MASRETSISMGDKPLSPSSGVTSVLSSTTATPTVPFTDLAAANQAFRELMEKHQHRIDILTQRVDSLTRMMNAVVVSQGVHNPGLSTNGELPASAQFTTNGLIGSPYLGANTPSFLPSLPTWQPPHVQPLTSHSVGPPPCSLTVSSWKAGTSSLVSPEGTRTPALAAVTLSYGGLNSNGELHTSGYHPSREGGPPSSRTGDFGDETGAAYRGTRHGLGNCCRCSSSRWSSQCTRAEDDDVYAINRENPETQCKSLPIEQFNPADEDQDFTVWISQFEDAVNQGHNPHSKRRHYNHCLSWLPNYLHPDAYVVLKRCNNRNCWEELKKELLAEYPPSAAIDVEWRSNLDAYKWDEHIESLTSYCLKVKKYVDTFDTDIVSVPQAKSNRYYVRFLCGLPDDYQRQIKLKTSSKKLSVDHALDVCLRYQSVKKEGLG